MSRLSCFALALLLALGLAAPQTHAEEEEPAAPAQPKEAAPAGAIIKIVEPGAEPHAQIRYKPTVGAKLKMTAELNAEFGMTQMGMQMAVGPVNVVIDLTIEPGTKPGHFGVAGTLTEVDTQLDPNDAMGGGAMFKPMIDALKGVTFTGEFTERGKWIQHPIANMQGVPSNATQFSGMIGLVFNAFITEVPEGAVGVGGSWTNTRAEKTAGIKMNAVTTYVVKSVASGLTTVSVSDKRDATNVTVNIMGQQMLAKTVKVTATGDLVLDEGLGVVGTGTINFDSDQMTENNGSITFKLKGKTKTTSGAAVTADPMAAMAMMGMPGAQHQALKALEGDWTATGTFWMGGPEPFVSEGACSNEMVLGGRYLRTSYTTTLPGMPGPFEGGGYLGYSNFKKRYEMLWLDNFSSSMEFITGSASEDGKTITFKGMSETMMGKIPVRHEYTLVDKDTYEFRSYMTQDDKESIAMQIIYKRK